jgi:hypothetical protein
VSEAFGCSGNAELSNKEYLQSLAACTTNEDRLTFDNPTIERPDEKEHKNQLTLPEESGRLEDEGAQLRIDQCINDEEPVISPNREGRTLQEPIAHERVSSASVDPMILDGGDGLDSSLITKVKTSKQNTSLALSELEACRRPHKSANAHH